MSRDRARAIGWAQLRAHDLRSVWTRQGRKDSQQPCAIV